MTRTLLILATLLSPLVTAPALAQRAAKPAAPAPIPTADARYTLLCSIYTGPSHYKRAEELRNKLTAASKLTGFYLVRGDGQTTLYHGYYRAFEPEIDPAAASLAQADKRTIETTIDAAGVTIIRSAIFVPMESPDPTAPSEWDLRNATGQYSLQIAAYKDHPDRKQAAVDTVRDMRKAGIDAYFFHGPTASSVCVGAWPKQAVVQRDVDEVRISGKNPALVLPPGMTAPGNTAIDEKGRRLQVVAPKLEVVDPTLLAAMKQYPEHAVNGMVNTRKAKDPATGALLDAPDPSYLIEIPRLSGVLAGEPAKDVSPEELETPLLIKPPTRTNTGLRSLGSDKPKP